MHTTTDPALEEISNAKMRSIGHIFLGDFRERVAILGAFDTWPYMDYISRILATKNYVAVTSRYIYRKINDKIMRMRIQEHPGFASQYCFMGTLLDQIISYSASAIINFSVSAAHFIETDWCHKKSKKTLGIAYVRVISGLEKASCQNLETIETDNGFYSVCKVPPEQTRTVWDCMKSSAYCPFIDQEISKNVIEYFFRGKDMEIVAVEDIGVLSTMLDDRYPALIARNPEISQLNSDIAKHEEVLFTRDCVYFMSRLNKLSKGLLVRARFVDMDLIGARYIDIGKFLERGGFVELKLESIRTLKKTLVKMKPKGRKLLRIYESL